MIDPCEWTWDNGIVQDVTTGVPYSADTNDNKSTTYWLFRDDTRFGDYTPTGHWYRTTGTGFKLTASLCTDEPDRVADIYLAVYRRLPDDYMLLENGTYAQCPDQDPVLEWIEWDSELGIEYFILVWTDDEGYAGPYTLTVSEDQGGT